MITFICGKKRVRLKREIESIIEPFKKKYVEFQRDGCFRGSAKSCLTNSWSARYRNSILKESTRGLLNTEVAFIAV